MAGFGNFALSLAMVAAFVLVWFGGRLVLKGRDRMRGWLMIGVALVLVANVLIWVWPASSPP
jgi:hypothetical protein